MRAITVRDAAALCSVSPGTIRRWADEGIIPSYRLPSGHRRFPPLKVIQFARKLVDGQPGGNGN
ncbi:MAG: helix-turn-helix domain-containing protein [Dehalococcoidia bacterium]